MEKRLREKGEGREGNNRERERKVRHRRY